MAGRRNFNELVAAMPAERRERIASEVSELHGEYVLSQIRKETGLTQGEVAARMGISQPAYAECERGENMRIGTLRRIVAALGGSLALQVTIDGRPYSLRMQG